MTDRDPTVTYPIRGNHRRQTRLSALGNFRPSEEQPADVATGLVSLGFIWAAIRRGARFWVVMAILGLLVGSGYYVKYPPAYKASTSVLLTYGPDESPASAVFDNQAIAESHTVAQIALDKLGLREGLGKFAAAYTVAVITDRVLQITASAPSSGDAVSRANAIANAFLQFRARQEESAQQVLVRSLEQELAQATQNEQNLSSQVSRVQAESSSPSRQAKLKSLENEHRQSLIDLGVIQQTVAGAQAGNSTLSAVTASVVLDPASPLAHSKLKGRLIYAVYGLLVGLLLGIGIIAVRAVVSDKLRRRDDIARALGAPVKLSVGAVRLGRRFLPGGRGLEAADGVEIRRIVAHLRDAVPPKEERAALAVIPVDDTNVSALSVASLAINYAEEGRRVVLADLVAGAPAAALLDNQGPGVRMKNLSRGRLTLAVPERDELAPVGPLDRRPAPGPRSQFSEETARACGSADIVLTLVTLDPALGGEHLLTWSDTAVAVVTAGRSSWTKVHAAGEMIRLAGTSLASVVLVGADKNDETLGAAEYPDTLTGIDATA